MGQLETHDFTVECEDIVSADQAGAGTAHKPLLLTSKHSYSIFFGARNDTIPHACQSTRLQSQTTSNGIPFAGLFLNRPRNNVRPFQQLQTSSDLTFFPDRGVTETTTRAVVVHS
jgi:hypothetical protein